MGLDSPCNVTESEIILRFKEILGKNNPTANFEEIIEQAIIEVENEEDINFPFDCLNTQAVVNKIIEHPDVVAESSVGAVYIVQLNYLSALLGLSDQQYEQLFLDIIFNLEGNQESIIVNQMYLSFYESNISEDCSESMCGVLLGYQEQINLSLSNVNLSDEEITEITEIFVDIGCDNLDILDCLNEMYSQDTYPNSQIIFQDLLNCSEPEEYNSMLMRVFESCGCPIGGTNELMIYDEDDAILEDEPKWGQLGNCDDIKNELSNIDLSGTLEEQINNIVEHFDCNVKYTRPQSGDMINCLQYNDQVENFCKVKKYLYTEQRGWLDILHVFTIFEWAINIYETGSDGSIAGILGSAVLAELEGYSGEAWQWAKENFSAFSYEDLCSNHVGAMTFVSFYQPLKDGDITWLEVMEALCTEFDAKEPSDAPNYDYIPYLVDDKYPMIFDPSTCLTGSELEQAGEANFCEMTLEQQLKLIEAHENFPH